MSKLCTDLLSTGPISYSDTVWSDNPLTVTIFWSQKGSKADYSDTFSGRIGGIFLSVLKSVQKSWHILEGYFPTCKPSRYTKQNLRLLTITTSKGFGIGPSSTEIGGGWIIYRTLKHPVGDSGGFQCLGPSNWTICSPLSQFHSEHFQTLSLSYWGPILITPEG